MKTGQFQALVNAAIGIPRRILEPVTVNHGRSLPLAQGVKFDIG